MRIRRRKDSVPGAGDGPPRDAVTADGGPRVREPSITGTYLTDGRSLYRVQHAITEADGLHLEEPLLELEDCATLELILCAAGALERLGLQPVEPSVSASRRPLEGPDAEADEQRAHAHRSVS